MQNSRCVCGAFAGARIISSASGPIGVTSATHRSARASLPASSAGVCIMANDLEFLLGILERDKPLVVAQEDFDCAHGRALRLWQRLGFVDAEPSANPAPSCPHCFEGVPYRIGERHICSCCGSTVERGHLD